MPVKQVIVIRKDLKMNKGKTAAQAAHASLQAVMWGAELVYVPGFEGLEGARGWFLPTFEDSTLEEWFRSGNTKICVGVDSEEELINLYKQGREIIDYCAIITDEGRTEFGGVPTKTAVAIGPVDSDELDKITGHLKLL